MIVGRNEIIKSILNEEVVAFPTDTVFGLASLPTNNGRKKIANLKGNDQNKKYTLMVSNKAEALRIFKSHPIAKKLVNHFFPGPLTIIAKSNGVYIGVRAPLNFEAIDILTNTGPLYVSSANPSGEKPFMTSDEVIQKWDIPTLEGRAEGNIASTVIKIDLDIHLIREGPILMKEIRSVLND